MLSPGSGQKMGCRGHSGRLTKLVIHANMVYLFTPIMFEAVLLYSSFLMIFAVLEESAGLLGSILMNDRVSGFCTSTKLVLMN